MSAVMKKTRLDRERDIERERGRPGSEAWDRSPGLLTLADR